MGTSTPAPCLERKRSQGSSGLRPSRRPTLLLPAPSRYGRLISIPSTGASEAPRRRFVRVGRTLPARPRDMACTPVARHRPGQPLRLLTQLRSRSARTAHLDVIFNYSGRAHFQKGESQCHALSGARCGQLEFRPPREQRCRTLCQESARVRPREHPLPRPPQLRPFAM